MMKKTSLALIPILFTASAFAAGGHGEGVPLEQIGWQAANLGILLIAIIIFIRKSIVEAFADRQKKYLEQAEKTKTALKQAEAALAEIKNKLSVLETGEQKSLEAARKEAAILSESMIKDAEQAVEKMKKEAEMIIANELSKAKAEINAAIVNQAIATTTHKLSNSSPALNSQDTNFIKQLEQVRA